MTRFLIFLLCAFPAFAQITVPDGSFQAAAKRPFVETITDWQFRVMVNGGDRPSVITAGCMERLRTTLIAQSITNKIWNMCIFVPDSVQAAFTPLFYHKGSNYWTNTFVIGDLDINGMKGNGSTKMADTGLNCTSGQAVSANGSIGCSVIVTEVPRGATYAVETPARSMMGRNDPDSDPQLNLATHVAGSTYYVCGDTASGGNYVQAPDFCRVGFLSANRADSSIAVYTASPVEPHRLLISDPVVIDDTTLLTDTIRVFCQGNSGTNVASTFTSNRLSMAMVHDVFTQTESSNVWWAVKECRECLGGGSGTPVHDWNRQIVALGGAAVSSTTSNAATAFWLRMSTSGVIDNYGGQTVGNYSVINISAPDDLTAMSVPLLWQAGHPQWQNVGFGTTNLTVAGLNGTAGGKYWLTGISNNTTAPSLVSANTGFGWSIMATNGLTQFAGGTTGAGNTHNTLLTTGDPSAGTSGRTIFYGGSASGANLNVTWLDATNFHGGYASNGMYCSGNTYNDGGFSGGGTARGRIYVAASTVTHYILTNNPGAWTVLGVQNNLHMLGWGVMVNTTPSYSGAATSASYLSLHHGLTQAQSSNEYGAVFELRTALGGGAR